MAPCRHAHAHDLPVAAVEGADLAALQESGAAFIDQHSCATRGVDTQRCADQTAAMYHLQSTIDEAEGPEVQYPPARSGFQAHQLCVFGMLNMRLHISICHNAAVLHSS